MEINPEIIANEEAKRLRRKEYYHKYFKVYNVVNKEKVSEQKKEYYRANKEAIKEKARKRYHDNKNKFDIVKQNN